MQKRAARQNGGLPSSALRIARVAYSAIEKVMRETRTVSSATALSG